MKNVEEVIDTTLTSPLTNDGSVADALENGLADSSQGTSTVEEYINWFSHLFFLFLPNVDIITDVLVLIYYFKEGGDYEFWGIVLAVILALSLRIQTFWFLIFFFYVESGDEEEFKDQDSLIMYVPFVGPFVASHGLVGEIGYEGPRIGRLFWCTIFEITLWVGIPFMIIMRVLVFIRTWVKCIIYLCRGCKKMKVSEEIKDQIRVVSFENRHLLLTFINSVEALYEAFPQLIMQLVVIFTVSKGDTIFRQYLSIAFSGAMSLLGLYTAANKFLKIRAESD